LKTKRRLAYEASPARRGFDVWPLPFQVKEEHARAEVSSMNTNHIRSESTIKKSSKKKKRKKKTALVVCRDRKQFWTTQTQFWQWVREGVVIKTGDQPLTGLFKREHEELLVLLSNTVLNLAHPNHMREALLSRRVGMAGK
jgi:hypothetical protein